MLSSFMSSVNEFFVAGLFSLAILAATVLASLAQIYSQLERVGVPVFLLGTFVTVLGIYLYLFAKRSGIRNSEFTFRTLPVFLVGGLEGRRLELYTLGREVVTLEKSVNGSGITWSPATHQSLKSA